ncbi:38028_t:CDS:10 [Gigaspora margarita]|uniref:38028_t:CDS:1 n=1 Tax=Gigaspora margarita TaxID=4874 RepID=A0ABN7UCU6_GIGMA|nr:38028_t:CDS:10 [Gigaspora margarita]
MLHLTKILNTKNHNWLQSSRFRHLRITNLNIGTCSGGNERIKLISSILRDNRCGSVRLYHDDGAFGYRIPRIFSMPDYTQEELSNRIENANLLRFITAYRTHGHRCAYIDPLGIMEREEVVALDHTRYGLTDPTKIYNLTGILHVNESKTSTNSKVEANLGHIISHLKKVYSGKVAYEFMHIPNASERRWFYYMIESFNILSLTIEQKRRIFEVLTRSEVFDHFMAKKFPQVKRYGLEGAESMIVALDRLFEVSNKSGIVEAVLCMPHRGRLNLLTDLLHFSPTRLFHKIKGNPEFPEDLPATGDVLSHLAISSTLEYGSAKPITISLLHNPSHLEAVNPVAMGKARAKQMDLIKSETDCELGDRVMCIQLHGDAAFTGQGVIMESFGLSNLPHFSSGGSIHIVVNNQLGYTTPAQNARSSWYCSDIGKMINAPVIHVNGDFPEEVTRAVEMAFEYRNKFRKDVIIDLISYRRWGHNELDEPAFTQPLMYNNIRSRKKNDISEFRKNYYDTLDEHYKKSDTYKPEADMLEKKWNGFIMPTETVTKMDTGKKIDWATAEALALGSLMLEGHNVRLCGQDVGRGTFSQRHAMIVCQDTERVIVPLNNLISDQGMLEASVVGFEYGMSYESPHNLVIWEAQFGDFFNGAQVNIDTYISSGEVKWLRQSGLVMLLPHGYDGAGPEHSSCRIERFLQANESIPSNPNMHIVNPTTPAQYFHVAVSDLEDMLHGTTFLPIIEDKSVNDDKVEKIIFVSGKLYYDLVKERQNKKLEDKVAIIRFEELCPFPKSVVEKELKKYTNAKEFIWCQEEPQNNGAYTFIEPRLKQLLPSEQKLKYIGRPPSAAPAVGISKWHNAEIKNILTNDTSCWGEDVLVGAMISYYNGKRTSDNFQGKEWFSNVAVSATKGDLPELPLYYIDDDLYITDTLFEITEHITPFLESSRFEDRYGNEHSGLLAKASNRYTLQYMPITNEKKHLAIPCNDSARELETYKLFELNKHNINEININLENAKITPPSFIPYYLEPKLPYSSGLPLLGQVVDINKILGGKDIRAVSAQDLLTYFLDQIVQLDRNKRITWRNTGVEIGMILNQNMPLQLQSSSSFGPIRHNVIAQKQVFNEIESSGTGQLATSFDNTWAFRLNFIAAWMKYHDFKYSLSDFFKYNLIYNNGDDSMWGIEFHNDIEAIQYLGNKVYHLNKKEHPTIHYQHQLWKSLKAFYSNKGHLNEPNQN